MEENEIQEVIENNEVNENHVYTNVYELNENKHTLRQVNLFSQIGRDYKENIKKEILKFNIYFWLLQVVLAGVAVTCFLFNNMLLAIVSAGIIIFDIVSIYRKRLKQFEELAISDDYRVGIYASFKDPRVIGSADRKVTTIRKSTSLIGIVGLIFGVMMLVQGFNVKPIEKESLKEESVHIFQDIYHGSKDIDNKDSIKNFQSVQAYVVPVIMDSSEFVYVIVPNVESEFDVDSYHLLTNGKNEEEIRNLDVKLYTLNQNASNATKGYIYVFGLEIEGNNYLDADKVVEELNTQQSSQAKMNMIVGGVVALIGLITFSSSYLFKLVFYKKMLEKEEINLNYTNEEKAYIDEQNKIALEEKQKELEEKRLERENNQTEDYQNLYNAQIVAKKKTSNLAMSLIVLIGGIVFFVYGLFFVKNDDNSMKMLATFLGAGMAIFGAYSLFDYLTYRITLDGNNLINKKFTKEMTYDISNVIKITYEQGNYVLLDYEDKPIFYFNAGLENAHEIIKNLHDRGIETSFQMK